MESPRLRQRRLGPHRSNNRRTARVMQRSGRDPRTLRPGPMRHSVFLWMSSRGRSILAVSGVGNIGHEATARSRISAAVAWSQG